ncbi:MAG: aldose 1-epimerase family protein, partial [Planctomycetota bacterium]|nr:aldose 1-epimerase family protein [Planctomycetota bacterium]
MPCFGKDLIDSWHNIYVPEWRIDADDLGLAASPARLWSIEKRMLHGGRQEGVDLLVVDNGRLLFTVVPSRGMSIHEAWCEGVRLGWDSPNHEIVHPMYARNEEKSGLGFLRDFNGWLVRCGLTHNGAPDVVARGALTEILPLHGRLHSMPASALRVEIDLA